MTQVAPSYITNEDIELRVGALAYVQLADDDGDNVADVAVVDEVRLAASGEVNVYLSRRYAVPIDTAQDAGLDALLRSVTLDLAEYRLRLRRPPVPSSVVKNREAAVRWLLDIADGRLDLPSVSEVAPNASKGVIASVKGESRTMSRESLDDF